MTLNKTKIEWTDFTWNPVTGCKHGCDYCYARRIAERYANTQAFPNGFEPTFHEKRLEDLRKCKTGDKIFVCSMADLFGEWVPTSWIQSVIDATSTRPDVIFQFLTKNPKRYARFKFHRNAWLGATVDGRMDLTLEAEAFLSNPNNQSNLRFLSVEPLLPGTYPEGHYLGMADWVIIGAMTGPSAKPYDRALLQKLIDATEVHCVPLFLKDSLHHEGKARRWPFYVEGI